jgi:oligogalacturonide lyase
MAVPTPIREDAAMFAHQELEAEAVTAADPFSGLPVTRLTAGCGHSHSLYFTSESWTRDRSQVVIARERDGANELWACAMAGHRLARLTAIGRDSWSQPHVHNSAALCPTDDRIAFWAHGRLQSMDLADGTCRTLYEAGSDEVHGLSWTADGASVLTCLSGACAMGSGCSTEERSRWLADPPWSRVLAVAADGSGHRVLHQERWLITHVNASPTDPDLCVFCHEGPWLDVDHRIWGLRLSGGRPWPVLERDPAWGVGHEYWLADGRTVGYHARHRDDPWRHAAGFADVVDGTAWQAELAVPTHHAVAQDRDLLILDGTRATGGWLMAVPRDGDGWGVPRVLCAHDASRHHHRAHVHPRLARDRSQVVFTSDRRGYSDAYLVPVPSDLSALPPWPGRPRRYYWE